MDIKFDSHFVRAGEVGTARGLKRRAQVFAHDKAKRLLENIPESVRDEATQKALTAGAKRTAVYIRKSARRAFDTSRKALDPGKYGTTYSSIKGKSGKEEFYPSAFVQVGGWYNLLEYGHRIVNRDGQQIGYSRPRQFFRPGLAAAQTEQDRAVLKGLEQAQPKVVDEAWRRTQAGLSGRKV